MAALRWRRNVRWSMQPLGGDADAAEQDEPDQVVGPDPGDRLPGDRRHQPAEAAHQDRERLGGEDRGEERQRRERRAEEPALGPGDEQQQVAAGDELQEHHRLQRGVVGQAEEPPARRGGEHLEADQQQAERLDHAEEAEDAGEREQPRHLPADRLRAHRRVVVGDGHDRDVVEQRHDDDHDRGQRLEAEEDRREDDEDHDVDGQRHAVDGVGGDAAEDAPGLVDGGVDHREAGGGQDQRRGAAGGVGGAGDGGAAVGLLEGGGVVDAVAGHGDEVAARLQRLDDGVLVLGEDAGVAVGLLDGVDDRRRHVVGVHVLGEGVGGGDDVGAHAELAGDLDGDGGVVAGDHLDGDALGLDRVDRRLAVIARRVEHRQDAEQRPGLAAVLGAGDGERPVALGGEGGDGVLDLLRHVGRRLRQVDDRLRGALGDGQFLALRVLDRRLGALGHRVEGGEELVGPGLGGVRVLQALDDAGVDRVVVLEARGEGAGEDDVLGVGGGEQDRVAELQLVLGQRAGLVGAEDVDAGHLLDGGEAGDDRLLLREREGAERHGDREDRGHGDRDRGDEQDEDELQDLSARRPSASRGRRRCRGRPARRRGRRRARRRR